MTLVSSKVRVMIRHLVLKVGRTKQFLEAGKAETVSSENMIMGFTFLQTIKVIYLDYGSKTKKYKDMKKICVISLSKEKSCFYFIIFHFKISLIYVFYRHAHFLPLS